MTEEHDLQGQLEVQGHHGDHAEQLPDAVGQSAGCRGIQQRLLRVAGGDGHGGVHEAEDGGVGVELHVVRLEVDGRLALAQGVHHGGHELSEDGQHGQLQVGDVREGHPTTWVKGNISSVQFSSVQDGIYALGKTYARSKLYGKHNQFSSVQDGIYVLGKAHTRYTIYIGNIISSVQDGIYVLNQFSSVQDGINVLGKAHTRSTNYIRNIISSVQFSSRWYLCAHTHSRNYKV